MVALTIDFREVDELGKTLRKVQDLATDLSPGFEAVHADLQDRQEKLFRLQGTPKRWAPLNPRYRKWKQRHFPGRKIGELTGGLQASFVARTTQSVVKIGKQAATLGTRAPHAHLFDEKRPLLQITPYMRRAWAEIVGEYLNQVVDSTLAGRLEVRLRKARAR